MAQLHKACKYSLLLLTFSLLSSSCGTANSAKISRKLSQTTPQDCSYFIQDAQAADSPVVAYDPSQVMEAYLRHYFSPWENPFISFSVEELASKQEKTIQAYLQKPGLGLNRHPHSPAFMQDINDNMDLAAFPNYKQPAITVRATNLRDLPCGVPSFTDTVSPGQGYPFDNFQESLLAANEPVYVLHKTQDEAWQFVVTGSHCYGWVKSIDLAYVTSDFIQRWQTGKYVTPVRDGAVVSGSGFAPTARVGQLFPLAPEQEDSTNHQVFLASANKEGYAEIKISNISKADTEHMPLLATPSNMARIANNLMGQPYAWGGLEGYRDCSAMLKDIFMPFGIWLPRNSGPQFKAGEFVSLEGLKNDQKEKLIIEQGTPFFTIIYLPGHVMLYIGAQAKKVYVFHDVWGLRTKSLLGKEGRAILGKVVITSLDFGKEYSNIKKVLLDKCKGMILLNKRLTAPHEEVELLKK